ncbi:MAG TPA: sn-glycerol-3-phosphate ABC transporter substrate-binding protein UgpB, partial [Geminicoccaceae bacterium]|nr:sn-glycerol-3-phosphate ABC transporter substrate-binding protein UgpB [Geminicoccaceae bacterium]
MTLHRTMLPAAATAVALAGVALAAPAQGQQQPTEIQWWHAMGGALGEKVEELARNFNETQDEYRVAAVYKGSYPETMTAAIAAFRAGEQPHVVQVFEVGTATMMAAEGAVMPVHQLMEEAGEPFDPAAFLEAVTGYYTTPDGRMLSLPFNSSTPVLYVNRDAFEQAGLDPDDPPETWPEVERAARAIIEAGAKPCGFTSAWPSWVQLENFSAWHNVPFATNENGFAGLDTELVFNQGPAVEHVANLGEWQKDKVFDYGGRRNTANAKFTSGECAMLTESSAGYAGIRDTAEFEFGVATLPYYPDKGEGAPQNTIIGGASLWVLAGHEPEEYRGVARFFSYLSSPEVQADWHQFTGYLPITEAAYELTKEQGFYEQNPGTDVGIRQMTGKEPTPNSKGIRLGNFVQIRDVIEEELETVFAGQSGAQEALDRAVERGNDLL